MVTESRDPSRIRVRELSAQRASIPSNSISQSREDFKRELTQSLIKKQIDARSRGPEGTKRVENSIIFKDKEGGLYANLEDIEKGNEIRRTSTPEQISNLKKSSSDISAFNKRRQTLNDSQKPLKEELNVIKKEFSSPDTGISYVNNLVKEYNKDPRAAETSGLTSTFVNNEIKRMQKLSKREQDIINQINTENAPLDKEAVNLNKKIESLQQLEIANSVGNLAKGEEIAKLNQQYNKVTSLQKKLDDRSGVQKVTQGIKGIGRNTGLAIAQIYEGVGGMQRVGGAEVNPPIISVANTYEKLFSETETQKTKKELAIATKQYDETRDKFYEKYYPIDTTKININDKDTKDLSKLSDDTTNKLLQIDAGNINKYNYENPERLINIRESLKQDSPTYNPTIGPTVEDIQIANLGKKVTGVSSVQSGKKFIWRAAQVGAVASLFTPASPVTTTVGAGLKFVQLSLAGSAIAEAGGKVARDYALPAFNEFKYGEGDLLKSDSFRNTLKKAQQASIDNIEPVTLGGVKLTALNPIQKFGANALPALGDSKGSLIVGGALLATGIITKKPFFTVSGAGFAALGATGGTKYFGNEEKLNEQFKDLTPTQQAVAKSYATGLAVTETGAIFASELSAELYGQKIISPLFTKGSKTAIKAKTVASGSFKGGRLNPLNYLPGSESPAFRQAFVTSSKGLIPAGGLEGATAYTTQKVFNFEEPTATGTLLSAGAGAGIATVFGGEVIGLTASRSPKTVAILKNTKTGELIKSKKLATKDLNILMNLDKQGAIKKKGYKIVKLKKGITSADVLLTTLRIIDPGETFGDTGGEIFNSILGNRITVPTLQFTTNTEGVESVTSDTKPGTSMKFSTPSFINNLFSSQSNADSFSYNSYITPEPSDIVITPETGETPSETYTNFMTPVNTKTSIVLPTESNVEINNREVVPEQKNIVSISKNNNVPVTSTTSIVTTNPTTSIATVVPTTIQTPITSPTSVPTLTEIFKVSAPLTNPLTAMSSTSLTPTPTATSIPESNSVTTPIDTTLEVPITVTDKGFPFIPGFNMGKSGKTVGFKSNKKRGYQASFTALAFGITAKKAPKQEFYSGQELRPIITGKDKKGEQPFGLLFGKTNKYNNKQRFNNVKW